MPNFLEQIGQGLRVAGGVSSPQVFRSNTIRETQIRRLAHRRGQMILQLAGQAVQNGSLDPQKYQAIAQKYGGPELGPSAQTQGIQREQAQEQAFVIGRQQAQNRIFASDAIPENQLQFEGEADVTARYDPTQNPALWEEYIRDREASQDFEEAQRAIERRDALRERVEPRIESGNIVTPQFEDREITGFDVQPLAQGEGKPSAGEGKVQRLTEVLGDRGKAIAVADGLHVLGRDDDGRAAIFNKSTGQIVGGYTPEQVAAVEKVQRAPVDIAAGTGVSGAFYRALNTLTGLFGGGLASGDAEKATNALDQLRVETISIGEAAIPGRPSNFQLQLIDTLTLDPRSVLTGDARALQKLRDTRDFLGREVDRMNNEVIARPRSVSVKELRETKDNVGKMSALVRQYDWAIDNMETRGRKSFEDIDKELESGR